jgi:hypothetical protein
VFALPSDQAGSMTYFSALRLLGVTALVALF